MEKCARCGTQTEPLVPIWFYGTTAKVCGKCYEFVSVEMEKAKQLALFKAEVTLRDYFAAKAMQGILANPKTFGDLSLSNAIAESSYGIADAMLAEREKNNA